MSDPGLRPAGMAIQPTPVESGFSAAMPWSDPAELQPGRLRAELLLFLLLIATFAAILFKDAVVERRFEVNGANIGELNRYWYADDTSGGKSTAAAAPDNPLGWNCELKSGFPYPFCGAGILFHIKRDASGGRDFSHYNKVVLDLDYHGPSTQLKLTLKNADPRYYKLNDAGSVKPNVLGFTAMQGRNHVVLDLSHATVERWWADQHVAIADADKPQRDNVIGIDVQTGDGARIGHYDFTLRQLSLTGEAITLEHWYQLLLGCWAGIGALYLAWRLVTIRRIYALRQQALVVEARQLEQSRDAAENASQAKSRFLAHMSHELRTPLNAILGYAQILKSIGQTERQVAAASTIQQSGEHLLALITDILDLSRIEAGKLELAPRPIDLRQMVAGVTEMIAVRAQEKSLTFHWAIASDVPRGVIADDKCLRQVLINLLGNAVKFTETGDVRLQLIRLVWGGGDVRLRFDVRDTGRGIPADHLHRIFEPFEQAGDRASRAGGTGLGLSISGRIVELMGSELKVESTEGVGSRFWFDISLPLADSGALPRPEQKNEGGAARARRAPIEAVPTGADMDRLHDLARAGNMRAIRQEAERLIRADARLRPFAEELLTLTRSYQSRAVLELIEEHKVESVAV